VVVGVDGSKDVRLDVSDKLVVGGGWNKDVRRRRVGIFDYMFDYSVFACEGLRACWRKTRKSYGFAEKIQVGDVTFWQRSRGSFSGRWVSGI
jgi:hypothetical protein